MELEGAALPLPTPKSMKLVLIRANGALFYSVAAAAVLESDAERAAGRMLDVFAADAPFCAWIKSEWLPCRRARARVLRDYIEQTWPEFDFAAALHEYAATSEGERGFGPQRTSAGHEALARCVSASQAALFYGALALWAEDQRLREVASASSQEESGALVRFRAVYERNASAGNMRWLASWFAARRMMRMCRDVQLPFLFACLSAHWRPHAPIAEMSYRDFVRRMRGVVRHRGKPGWAERAVFAPWGRRPRPRAVQSGRVTAWFKPAVANLRLT
jgi:hypothetical protein